MMELVTHETPEEVAKSAAARIAGLIAAGEGRFSLGLAGGSTPAATYEALRAESVDWERVDLWLSDERWVSHDDERSNGLMATRTLIAEATARLERPRWSEMMEPSDSAVFYEATLRSIHPETGPDLVLLGMGADGHTASLFPDSKALDEEDRWFVANTIPQTSEPRLTVTYPLLWRARRLLVLTTGESKAPALRDSLAGLTPAGRIDEGDAEVEWHVDQAAASLLS